MRINSVSLRLRLLRTRGLTFNNEDELWTPGENQQIATAIEQQRTAAARSGGAAWGSGVDRSYALVLLEHNLKRVRLANEVSAQWEKVAPSLEEALAGGLDTALTQIGRPLGGSAAVVAAAPPGRKRKTGSAPTGNGGAKQKTWRKPTQIK